jgi:serine/threonine protein kinase
MGEVWKARDTQLQRYVAIKLMHADLQGSPDFVAHFTREARLVAALRHPNIVQIHDFQFSGTQGETAQAYMVMDYIEGGTLASAIRNNVSKGTLWSANEIVELFAAISLALDYAHEQGMIHRDIKPANILLDRSLAGSRDLGVPILTDFGIARWHGSGSTVSGFVGTPLYISPEQAQSQPVDARSDLYSLGIILYEVLTGVTPFRGDNPLGIMLQHVEEPPPAPSLINPLVSPALSAVVLRSIAKDPRERFPSATAMTRALAQAFNLPIPALLEKPGEKQEPLTHNPLQPRSGAGSVAPHLAPTPPRTFTPVTENVPEPRQLLASPMNKQSQVASGVNNTPTAKSSPAPSVGSQPSLTSPVQPLPVGTARAGRRTFPRKWLLLVSLGCLALLLLGFGAAVVAPHLFPAPSTTPTPASSAVAGRILFLSNSYAPKGVFNTLQIDLTSISYPPSGLVYYAWLISANSETPTIPHWSLQVNNGAIHALYTSPAPQTDLFTFGDRLLITTEDAANTPVIPYPLPVRHLYYAIISHTPTSSPSFAVRYCPTSNVDSASNPCR